MNQLSCVPVRDPPGRRGEILEVARRIFADRGYSNTSMRDIAEAAGLLAGSLYSHFRSKAEILQLVVMPLVERLQPAQEAAIASPGCGLERFERMIEEALAVLVEHREEAVIMHYDWSDLSEIPDLADLASSSNYLLELWRSVVEAGQADGSIRPDVRAEVVVRAVTSALHASVDSKRYGALPMGEPAPGAPALAAELTALFAIGLARRASQSRRTRRSDDAEPSR